MFLGQYQHTLDDKGRMTIPSAFRESLSDGAYISKGLDQNLMVMSARYFELMYKRLNALNITDPTTRLLRELMLGSSYKLEMDKAGRILLPPQIRQLLSNENELVLLGQGEYFEIWVPEKWTLQMEKLNNTEANTQKFAMLDLSTGI